MPRQIQKLKGRRKAHAALPAKKASVKKAASRSLVFAGDIGGTKTRLGLFERKRGSLISVKTARFLNSGFASVEGVVERFLAESSDELKGGVIRASALGIACPVAKNRCELTNLKWTVDGTELGRKFGLPRVELVNDIVALACGVPFLDGAGLLAIQQGEPGRGNAALIAAGTGLGEATLFWDGERRLPSASEAGHADFAPTDSLQAELFEYLHKQLGHVSYERVLSGQGLVNIYEFFKAGKSGRESEYLKEKFLSSRDPAEVIYNEAANGGDQKCREALRMFISIYGAEAGNLALRSMATAGVYVGGGIAPKVLADAKSQQAFLAAFTGKGRFSGLVSRVPVYIIVNDNTALIGAANRAAGLV